MSYLSHDNRLWAHTWDHDAAANRFRARFTRETRGLSAWLNARAGRLAKKALNARLLRDAYGADASLPLDNHLRDAFGRPVL